MSYKLLIQSEFRTSDGDLNSSHNSIQIVSSTVV